jgi:hypothetical protein
MSIKWIVDHAFLCGLAANLLFLSLWCWRMCERPTMYEEIERMRQGFNFRGRPPKEGSEAFIRRAKIYRDAAMEFYWFRLDRLWWFFWNSVPIWALTLVACAMAINAKSHVPTWTQEYANSIWPTCQTLLIKTWQSITFDSLTVAGQKVPDLDGGLLFRLMMLIYTLITALTIGKLSSELFQTGKLLYWAKSYPNAVKDFFNGVPGKMDTVWPFFRLNEMPQVDGNNLNDSKATPKGPKVLHFETVDLGRTDR